MGSITELLNQYGYIVLYISLLLELIALPLPGEALMTYCGVIVGQDKLNWMFSIIVSTSGAMIGTASEIYAGYVFGGVWLTLNIILLEVYKILSKINLVS